MIACTRRIRFIFAIALLALFCPAAAPPAQAESAVKQAPSLALVPEDAASYAVLLHNKDAFDAVVGSKAYAKLLEIDEVRDALEAGKTQWEAALGDPAMKGLIQALLDGLSHEVFFYVDPSYARFNLIYQRANMHGSMMAAASSLHEPDPFAQMRGILDVLADHAGELETPIMVIGMKMSDPDAAEGAISFVKLSLGPQLKNAGFPAQLEEEKVGGVKLTTLKMNGGMIPWEEIPLDQISEEPGKYDGLVAKLKTMTLAISMGVKDDYLIVSMGPTNEHVAALGKGKTLAGRPEMAKLNELNGKKLCSLSYVSQEGAQLNLDAALAPFAAMIDAVPQFLPPDTEDMLRGRIKADLKEFNKDVQKQIPAAGAMLSATTFSPHGFDTVSFNWTKSPQLDSSQPLTLLDHIGGDPICYAVAREKQDPQQYEMMVKWLGKIDGYLSQLAEQEEGEAADDYKKFRQQMAPLLARLDTANRKKLMPALKDGQTAVVLDAKMTSKQWLQAMPASPHPLPLPELAMVRGVSDAKLLKQGCREYFAVAKEVARILHEIDPDGVPEIDIPAPQHRDVAEGEIYFYPLPKEAGADKRIAPTAGLSDNVAVLALTRRHARRLLRSTPPAADGPLAQYKNKPIGVAVGFNFAALVDAAVPWVEYGIAAQNKFEIQQSAEDQPAPDAPDDEPADPEAEKALGIVRTVADVLKCFRGYSAVTYREDGVLVTRGQWRFEDLP